MGEFRNGPRGEEVGGTPADMAAFLHAESARLEPVIRAAKIAMD